MIVVVITVALSCIVIGVLPYSLYSLTLNVSAIRVLLEEQAARERATPAGATPRGSS